MDGMASIQEMAELDLNDPLFKTDAFMVYGFKVLQCRRTRRHDWRECPFAHPGEVARRRDPRVYTYVGIICPDAKQNSPCPRGDRCPYTHSLFEYWLHPTRYKTEFCSRGRQCTRPFCFFAHSETEMRPVDTEALLAVAMRPADVEPTRPPATAPLVDDPVAQTAELLQKTRFFGPPPLRTHSLSEASLTRNAHYAPTLNELHGLRMGSGASLLTQQPGALTMPWDTIYENGDLDATQLDLHRRYSMSDATQSNDIISRLGLGYLQQSAKQRLFHQNANGSLMNEGLTPVLPGDTAHFSQSPADLTSLLGSLGRGTKSLDDTLLPSVSETHLQAFLTERGHSLPTTLGQNSAGYY